MGLLRHILQVLFFHGPLHFKAGSLRNMEKNPLKNLNLGLKGPEFFREIIKSKKVGGDTLFALGVKFTFWPILT